jgi:amidohydrolase
MNISKEELKSKVVAEIEKSKEKIINFSKDIAENAETGYREVKTSNKIKEIFDSLNLKYTDGHAITGVKSEPIIGKSEGPTIAVIGELDGLIVKDHPLADPKTNAVHACGHNCQLGSMLGAGLGLLNSKANEYLNGNVVLFAVPAEETIENEFRINLIDDGKLGFMSGKQELIRIGSFDDIDSAMLSHATTNATDKDLSIGGTSLGHVVKYVEFHGRASHAAGAPYAGVNALKAANIAMMAMDLQRESFKDEDKVRVHGILTEGGTATNSIPSIVKLEWRIRGRTIDIVNEVNKKIDRSLKAGAMAMGANVRIRSIAGNLPMLQNKDINNIYFANAANIVGNKNVVIHPDDTSGGSTDMGDLSQIMPVIHPRSGGAIGAGHGNDYFIDDYYKSVINPAKAMATTIIDLLWHEENKLKEIISEHVPVYTKKEYIDLQKSRMGNEFHEYMKS